MNVNVNLIKKNAIQINGGIKLNVDVCEKDYAWNRPTCDCKNGQYLASVMDDSVITCDEIIDVKKNYFN